MNLEYECMNVDCGLYWKDQNEDLLNSCAS